MIARLSQPLHSTFLAITLVSVRIMAAFAILPATGEQFLQGLTRAGLVVVIAAFCSHGMTLHEVSGFTPLEWLGFVLKEALIGVVLGYAAATVFWIAESVGALIDTQSGFNSVQMTNPLSGEQSTPVSNMMLQLVVAVFYLLGGMLAFIGVLFESFRVWPLLSPLPSAPRVIEQFILQQTDTMMISIVKFAAPALLVLILIDLGFGLITRAADKLEPSNLSQPIKGAVTMLLLALLIGIMLTQVRHLLLPTGLLGQLKAVFGL